LRPSAGQCRSANREFFGGMPARGNAGIRYSPYG
jgi:hypothetical protein